MFSFFLWTPNPDNLLRCFTRLFAFQPLVWRKKNKRGKTEHKLSDAWTYEYLSVNASRWPWITQTECPGRVPHLRGDLYDHEMISRQDGFREIDPFVFGLTPPRWCMIAAIICVRIWFVSSSSDNTSVRICFLGLYFLQESCTDVCADWLRCIHAVTTFQGSTPFFVLGDARRARTFSPWPWCVRTTSADEPNVTCRVSGMTPSMGSSIITSLMGLECSQSFMTAFFMARDPRAETRSL